MSTLVGVHPNQDESSHRNIWLHIRRTERDLAADDERHRRHPSHQRNGLDQEKFHLRPDETFLILQLVGLVRFFRLPVQALDLLKRSVQSLLLRRLLECLMKLQHPPSLPHLLSTPHHLLLFHLRLVILRSLCYHPIHHFLHLLPFSPISPLHPFLLRLLHLFHPLLPHLHLTSCIQHSLWYTGYLQLLLPVFFNEFLTLLKVPQLQQYRRLHF